MPSDFLFPKWTNRLPKYVVFLFVVSMAAVSAGFYFFAAPDFLEAGYEPVQPINFSHKVHAGNLGMDCRYCHFNVERAASAGVPPTETCMNCHRFVLWDTPTVRPVTQRWTENIPIQWVRVHRLPGYTYFSHQPHVRAGLDCAACHGEVAKMDRVRVAAPMSMGWCLNCHRNLEKQNVSLNFVASPSWESQKNAGRKVVRSGVRARLNPPKVDCSGCHR